MDSKIKDFINHLYQIGLVNSQSSADFLSIYTKHKLLNADSSLINSNNSLNLASRRSIELNNSLKDVMQTVLSEFLSKQDAASIQTMSFDIVSKYSESTFLDRTKYAKKIYFYFLRFYTKKSSYYFLKWRANLKKRWKTEKSLALDVMTSKEKKEQDSLMSCTFKPQINRTSRSMSRMRLNSSASADPFTRLYTDHIKYKTKKELIREDMLRKQSKLLRSTPEILNSQLNMSIQLSNPLLSKSFIERQEEYGNKKIKNKDRILKETEETENLLYTFNPSINQNKINISYPAHQRLYR